MDLRSFRNSPLVINSLPRVFRPSNASWASCWAESLVTGTPGFSVSPEEMVCASHRNSCKSCPSFLLNISFLACSITFRRSLTRAWPSPESSWDGDERALEVRALFRATSHCLFYGRKQGQQALWTWMINGLHIPMGACRI